MTETPDNDLLRILDLEQIDDNLFRGQNQYPKRSRGRLFGGQVLSQSLTAAKHTVDQGRNCHSLHAYFLRPGRVDIPVVYRIERIRDGRSFTTRRIVAIQNGEAIFSMDASFHVNEPGLSHQIDVGDFPGPDELESDVEIAKRLEPGDPRIPGWSRLTRTIETRTVYPFDKPRPDNNMNPLWLRFKLTREEIGQHTQGLLTYATDMGLLAASLVPHLKKFDRNRLQMASLDHAVWFHREADLSGWILFVKDTPSSNATRGMNRGSFYTEDGTLLASALQEGLMRVMRE